MTQHMGDFSPQMYKIKNVLMGAFNKIFPIVNPASCLRFTKSPQLSDARTANLLSGVLNDLIFCGRVNSDQVRHHFHHYWDMNHSQPSELCSSRSSMLLCTGNAPLYPVWQQAVSHLQHKSDTHRCYKGIAMSLHCPAEGSSFTLPWALLICGSAAPMQADGIAVPRVAQPHCGGGTAAKASSAYVDIHKLLENHPQPINVSVM